MDQPALKQSIERVLKGDVEAFGPLVREFQVPIRAFLAARLDDTHEAEDLAQEVFLIVFRRLSDFDATRPMSAWLRGIAANVLRNHLRRRREQTHGAAAELAEAVEQSVARVEQDEGADRVLLALRICLRSLDAGARDLVERRYMAGHSLAELGDQLQRRHSTLTMALHRIRCRLRECVQRQLQGAEG